MGVRENIQWLKENKERTNLFVMIARRGPFKIRELRRYLNTDDWWLAKCYVKDLADRGLIAESEGRYRVTEAGEKVFESLKAVHDIESI